MEVATPLTEDMRYFSDFYKPCSNLEAGWCNIPCPCKLWFNPTEMMIVAYHNKAVVYAYKGLFNRNLDAHWSGGVLLNPGKIVDRCRANNGVPPDPSIGGNMGGLAFDKISPGVYTHNCDTYNPSFPNPGDCRFADCGIHQNSQMTMAIYIR
jgi:hypothetical protein